jgi:hypothetical protein
MWMISDCLIQHAAKGAANNVGGFYGASGGSVRQGRRRRLRSRFGALLGFAAAWQFGDQAAAMHTAMNECGGRGSGSEKCPNRELVWEDPVSL